MTIDEIQSALKFDMDMQLFDATTGETCSKDSLKYGNEMNYVHYCANEEAIELLEELKQLRNQQTPKKIIYEKQSYGTPYRCAECEADQTPIEFFHTDGSEPKEKYSWCWHCGQKLDWSDVK